MIENKLYTSLDLMMEGIYTGDFLRMEEPCQVNGTLVLKAYGNQRTMRMFFVLEDGRKIFTPVFWWQQYLGLLEKPIGTKFRLTYAQNAKGIHLAKAEMIYAVLPWQASDLPVQIRLVRAIPDTPVLKGPLL